MRTPTMLDLFRQNARDRSDETVYWSPNSVWTFSAINLAANRIANGFVQAGIQQGDRIACLSKHTAETVLIWLAAAKIGAVCMPVNWRLAPPEVDYILSNGDAKVLVLDDEFANTARQLTVKPLTLLATLEGFGDVPSLSDWMTAFSETDPGYQAQPDDTALQLYSSGTTGLPKGVLLTYRSMAANLQALPDALSYQGAPDVMHNVLPAFHVAGIGVAIFTAAMGGKLVLYPEFNPKQVLDAFEEHKITHSFLVPAMIQFVLQEPDIAQRDLSHLRSISYGASPITESVLLEGMRVFGCEFAQVYGLTETTGAVTVLKPENHQTEGPRQHLLRSCGAVMSGVELKIVDPESNQELPDEKVGEVWIRSEQNMAGYWSNEAATNSALVPDERGFPPWFRSGDAGYLRDGHLFIHDRIKDMIISGGENIYPAEVENVLMKHPDVGDGAVIGVPDEKWGEAVKAVVVPAKDKQIDADALIAYMRENLAHYKCPKTVDITDEIPRNPSGKILKRVLREPYWAGVERNVS